MRRGFAVLPLLVVLSPLAQPACATGSTLTSDDGGPGSDSPAEASDAPPPGEGGEGGGGDGGGTTATKACGDWVHNYCAQLEMCANFLLITTYGDKLTCSTQLQKQCLDVLAAPGTGFTGDTLEACLVKVKTEGCFAFLYGKPAPAACQIFGTTDNGKGCRYDSQCRSGYCKLSGTCGNCVMRGLTGSPCSAAADCDSNLMCAGNSTCQPPQDTGAACDTMTHPCKQGLVCVGGACAAEVEVGAACGAAAVCDYAQGVYCDSGSMACKAYTIPMNGMPCDGSTTVCFGGASCTNGSCVAAGPDGSMCDAMQGIGCVSPDTCTAGTCQLFSATQCM